MTTRKQALERCYLYYSPLWIGVVAVVMLSRIYASFADLGYMLLGVAMALPLWLWPFFVEKDRPLVERYSIKAAVYIALLSFLQNYFGTPLFFNCFGLRYHFPVTILPNGSPLFLSFMTVAYFSTYFAVMSVGLSAVEKVLAKLPRRKRRALWLLAAAAMSYVMALLETLFMASKYLEGYFAYADKQRMMSVGSLCYGTLLFVAIVVFYGIDADEKPPMSLGEVTWRALGVNTLVLCAYEVYSHMLCPTV